jgi:hypothetical protein
MFENTPIKTEELGNKPKKDAKEKRKQKKYVTR